MEKVYTQTKRIDYVVNSAGILRMGKLSERAIEDIQEDIDINRTVLRKWYSKEEMHKRNLEIVKALS